MNASQSYSHRHALPANTTPTCQHKQLSEAICILIALLLTAGCGQTDESSKNSIAAKDAESDIVTSEVERGPVKLTVQIEPAKPRLSDEPKLTVTIRSEEGIRIAKPPFGSALGEFLIRDFYEPVPEVDGTATIIRQIYTLEPTRAGKVTVAPIAVQFHDERSEGDGKEHSIESEALTVEVSTVLGDDAPSLADLRPAAGPVELPESGGSFGWWIAGLAIAVLVFAGFLWKRRRRIIDAAPQLSPQELAWLELEHLVEQNLAEAAVKEFYVELTGVVRRYIERSTGVRAPEQTTEEFLREISERSTFATDENSRLRDFLESADLVKFAGFAPSSGDIEQSFDRANLFIGLKRAASQEVAA